MFSLWMPICLALSTQSSWCSPSQQPLASSSATRYFDVQAHRGGRGNTVESILPCFAWGLIDGATTLELDNGITKDGVVVVWHDEKIVATKCSDTTPVFEDDPDFPYVGKNIANLTLAQLKTIDCGSKRQRDFPVQLVYPGVRISTLQETFDFVECADPEHKVQWNIESKINALFPDETKNVTEFVERQYEVFINSPYKSSITYQSFDWRSLVAMKEKDPLMITSALIDSETSETPENGISPWLAGLRLDSFPGATIGEKIAEAAKAIKADILSTADIESYNAPDPGDSDYRPFTTRQMIVRAHELGLAIKPWTVNRLGVAEQLFEWGIDGIITDYPNSMRRLVQQRSLPVAPKYPKKRVLECLSKHMDRQ